jgi:hypothetical protein
MPEDSAINSHRYENLKSDMRTSDPVLLTLRNKTGYPRSNKLPGQGIPVAFSY